MKFKYLLFFIYSTWLCNLCIAQNNVVHIDQSTGAANVVIPLYTINAAHISLPISLSYNATGLRASEVEGTAGMGWNLNAGGSITRQVRGLPDDMNSVGWMFNGVGSNINQFNIANLGSASTCSDETTDINYIKQKFNASSIPLDTEPDIFYVSVPGLSCQLVYDNVNNSFRSIPYQDIKIVCNYNTSSGISSFSITNDEGITYNFAAQEYSYQKADNPTLTASTFFAVMHNQYSGGVGFCSVWNLTSINDNYNNSIYFSYVTGTKKGFKRPVQVIMPNQGLGSNTVLYNIWGHTTPNLVSQISYSDGVSTTVAFNFTYNTNIITQKSFIASIVGLGRNFQFGYQPILSPNPNKAPHFVRNFLSSVTDGDCSTPFNYTFNYNNPGSLPDSTCVDIDYYGYYNAIGNATLFTFNINTYLVPASQLNKSTAGYDRYKIQQSLIGTGPSPTPLVPSPYNSRIGGDSFREPAPYPGSYPAAWGTLTQITYADGGNTNLTYELNDYYDKVLGGNVYGSGIRIKQMQDNDGNGKLITKTYSYVDPNTGFSSGQPLSMPIFAFTRPYTPTATDYKNKYANTSNEDVLWEYSTIKSASDLSTEPHTVYYSSVTETQDNAGYTVYQFSNPAMYGAAPITGSLSWSPTMVFTGRNASGSTCPSISLLMNDMHAYPFPPSPNYDFERGLVSHIINYNANGQKVSQVDYTYTTPGTPITISALKFDYFNNSSSYGNPVSYCKYPIYTNSTPLVTQKTSQVFDLTQTTNVPLSTGQKAITNYVYGGTLHKKPTQISVLNSDGALQTTNITYVKDYAILAANHRPLDSSSVGILNLQKYNVNSQIEKYFQVTSAGSTTPITTGGELMQYRTFNPQGSIILTLPARKLKFLAGNGTAASFQPSYVNNSGTIVNDPNYVITSNYLAYDFSGNLLSKDDGFNNIETTFIDHNTSQTTAVIKGAMYNNIAISDFDTKTLATNFIINAVSSTAAQTINNISPGRTGNSALVFGQGVSLTTNLPKNNNAQNYILSFWIKSPVAGQIDANITSNATNSLTVPFSSTTNTPTGWQYCQVKLPLTGLLSNTFTVNISLNPVGAQTVAIDDILCYPDVAEVSTFSYDPVTHYKTAETNTNGISNYFNVDQFGRINYVQDQDKNIVLKNTYSSIFNVNNINETTLSFIYTVSNNVYTFTNTTPLSNCAATPLYIRWQFPVGDYVYTTGTQTATYTNKSTTPFQVSMWIGYDQNSVHSGNSSGVSVIIPVSK